VGVPGLSGHVLPAVTYATANRDRQRAAGRSNTSASHRTSTYCSCDELLTSWWCQVE